MKHLIKYQVIQDLEDLQSTLTKKESVDSYIVDGTFGYELSALIGILKFIQEEDSLENILGALKHTDTYFNLLLTSNDTLVLNIINSMRSKLEPYSQADYNEVKIVRKSPKIVVIEK